MSQVLQGATIDDLRGRIDGEVIAPQDPAYDEARKVWNGMIDCHPGGGRSMRLHARRGRRGDVRPRERRPGRGARRSALHARLQHLRRRRS